MSEQAGTQGNGVLKISCLGRECHDQVRMMELPSMWCYSWQKVFCPYVGLLSSPPNMCLHTSILDICWAMQLHS